MDEMLSRILLPILEHYMSVEDNYFGGVIKEQVHVIGNINLIVYPNDHNPPHFHVKSKDGEIDAKFQIEDGTIMKGSKIDNQSIKKIQKFYNDPKSQHIFKKIWDKYQGTNLSGDVPS